MSSDALPVVGTQRSGSGLVAAARSMAWRSLLKIRNTPDTLIDAVAQPAVILVLFTYGFGGAISGSPQAFLQYFAPSVAIMGVVMLSMSTGFAVNKDIATGFYERLRTLPVRPSSVLIGPVLADTLRYLIATVVTFGLGLALGFRPGAGALGIILAALYLQYFAFTLAWVWTWLGIILRTPGSAEGVIMMANAVVLFGSNILAPVDTMPGWVRFIVGLNPVSHASTTVRGLVHGTLNVTELAIGVLSAAGLLVIFGSLSIIAFKRLNVVGGGPRARHQPTPAEDSAG